MTKYHKYKKAIDASNKEWAKANPDRVRAIARKYGRKIQTQARKWRALISMLGNETDPLLVGQIVLVVLQKERKK